jgi:hypothetical protein
LLSLTLSPLGLEICKYGPFAAGYSGSKIAELRSSDGLLWIRNVEIHKCPPIGNSISCPSFSLSILSSFINLAAFEKSISTVVSYSSYKLWQLLHRRDRMATPASLLHRRRFYGLCFALFSFDPQVHPRKGGEGSSLNKSSLLIKNQSGQPVLKRTSQQGLVFTAEPDQFKYALEGSYLSRYPLTTIEGSTSSSLSSSSH